MSYRLSLKIGREHRHAFFIGNEHNSDLLDLTTVRMKIVIAFHLFVLHCMTSLCARAAFSSRLVARHRRGLLALLSSSSAAVSIMANPLLQQDGLPKFAHIEPTDLSPAIQELLPTMEKRFEDFEQTLSEATVGGSVPYDMVLPQLEKIQFPLGFAWGVAGHLNGVKNGDDLRRAYEENQPKIVQAMSKFAQSKPLYDALSIVSQELSSSLDNDQDDGTNRRLARQRRRAVDHSLQSMTLGGVGLTGPEKEAFNEMQMRLAQLSTTFSNNVLDETKAYSLTITDGSKLEGVPESAKAMWANAHSAAATPNQDTPPPKMDAELGPWRITLDSPSYIAVLSHVKDRNIREQVYKASIRRASSSDKNNIPLVYEILQLRTKMSKLLGFDMYAEQSLARKMAPSVQAVQDLTDLIAARALPAAERELAEITALARQVGGDEYACLDKLQPWDVTYWSERLKESKFNLTEEETRPYFALPAVLDGMFSLVSRIFDIEVKRAADGEAEVWHPDVWFFKVFDQSSSSGGEKKHIASFYLDPYSRPENKRGGAWMDVCIGKSKAVLRDIPVAYLTCNGSPPVGAKPSLMTFREVETLFHEFGHGLQHMLTTVEEGDVAGINGVEWDAVELPSQFMENW
jgi:oligopeptidase A